jgi:hypothetical protein
LYRKITADTTDIAIRVMMIFFFCDLGDDTSIADSTLTKKPQSRKGRWASDPPKGGPEGIER